MMPFCNITESGTI